ncbi:terpenoid synthase [Bombardia bombarda]|uniref:Terpene synthase n=1 Tax=Bombardia bombarda TaxID=252184 RepID=A0AA40C8P7_9PEZI|nr:terpenoid synthase [Bombardia bombarda]
MAAEKVNLPNLVRNWPYPRQLNQHYDEVSAATSDWVRSFQCFDQKSQAAFDKCDFPKLALLTTPHFDLEHARTSSDLMALFFVFDEFTDVEDEHVTRQMSDIFMDALRNPDKPRPQGEVKIGEMTRQFWDLGRKTATPMAERHLIETMQLYVDSVVQEAEDRRTDRVRTVDEYWELRRHTCGCFPTFVLAELEMDIPEEIYQHPLLERMRECAMYSVCVKNDLYSYNIERARGHGLHNLLTVVMNAQDLGLQAAVNFIGDWHDKIIKEFFSSWASLPSWGEDIDRQVQYYVESIVRWVRGCSDWSFEAPRYFGTQAPEIQRTLQLYMLPRVDALTARDSAHREALETDKHDIAGMQITVTVR